jgi:trehalose-6-phosphatase
LLCAGIPSQIQLTDTDQEVEVEEVESEDSNMNDPYELGDIKDKVEVALEYIGRAEAIQNMMSITEFRNAM